MDNLNIIKLPDGEIYLEIFDGKGILVFCKVIVITGGNYTIDLANHSTGIYLLSLRDSFGKFCKLKYSVSK